jgi:hypothetical protein
MTTEDAAMDLKRVTTEMVGSEDRLRLLGKWERASRWCSG